MNFTKLRAYPFDYIVRLPQKLRDQPENNQSILTRRHILKNIVGDMLIKNKKLRRKKQISQFFMLSNVESWR